MATFSIQSVGRFNKSRFHDFRDAYGVHHVIIPPDFEIKEGCFCVWFDTPGEPRTVNGHVMGIVWSA
jgi:hypothetical protein